MMCLLRQYCHKKITKEWLGIERRENRDEKAVLSAVPCPFVGDIADVVRIETLRSTPLILDRHNLIRRRRFTEDRWHSERVHRAR